MIISMTGFGAAGADEGGISCGVEVRAVNNRFFKAVIKLPDKLTALEPELDKLLRETLARGSVVMAVAVKDVLGASSVKINHQLLAAYVQAAKDAYYALKVDPNAVANPRLDAASLLALPGVIEAGDDTPTYLATHHDFILRLCKQALANLTDMRKKEGAALLQDLTKHVAVIRHDLGEIQQFAPQVAKQYHEKLRNRVLQMVNDAKLSLSDQDLLKEVALFTDRADISEEINRLGGHLDQFEAVCQKESEAGRKLDFIAQEMLREANTIASKANDSEISKRTVNIKSAIDRIKEQVQNVE
ncbi:MAG: YicC/YloC family endoribonuclease [Phycisphaerae bacterium]